MYHLLSIQIFYYFWYHLCCKTSHCHKLHILYINLGAYKKSQAKCPALICSLTTVTESRHKGIRSKQVYCTIFRTTFVDFD